MKQNDNPIWPAKPLGCLCKYPAKLVSRPSECICGGQIKSESDARLQAGPGQQPEDFPRIKSVAQQRKETPIYSGVIRYFPRALEAVAQCSFLGNEQHNPGTPLHWDRSKSQDELDALARHLKDAGTLDDDGVRHSTKVAWRALANLEKELEAAAEKGSGK